MNKLNAKTQKRLLVSGLTALCIVLAAVLFTFVGGSEKNIYPVANNMSGNTEIKEIQTPAKTVVSVPAVTEAPATTTSPSQPDKDVVLDVDKQQNVEVTVAKAQEKPAEPEKPVIKDEEAIKNPDKKPEYDKSQTTVEPKNSQSKSGDKKDGKVYIPGFGWVKDEGGGGQGKVGKSDGDINKQVGSMD